MIDLVRKEYRRQFKRPLSLSDMEIIAAIKDKGFGNFILNPVYAQTYVRTLVRIVSEAERSREKVS